MRRMCQNEKRVALGHPLTSILGRINRRGFPHNIGSRAGAHVQPLQVLERGFALHGLPTRLAAIKPPFRYETAVSLLVLEGRHAAQPAFESFNDPRQLFLRADDDVPARFHLYFELLILPQTPEQMRILCARAGEPDAVHMLLPEFMAHVLGDRAGTGHLAGVEPVGRRIEHRASTKEVILTLHENIYYNNTGSSIRTAGDNGPPDSQ